MKNKIKEIAVYTVVALVFVAIAFSGWKLERWINWKFDYGSRVDSRIEKLEERVRVLESKNTE